MSEVESRVPVVGTQGGGHFVRGALFQLVLDDRLHLDRCRCELTVSWFVLVLVDASLSLLWDLLLVVKVGGDKC